jgi:hypothetical protein
LEGSDGSRADRFTGRGQHVVEAPLQMGLFSAVADRFRDRLAELDVARLTPIDALNLLHKLSEEAKK